MSGEKQQDLLEWLSSTNGNALNVWREAMTQMRQLHNDVWNGVRFFLTVISVLIAGIFATAKDAKANAIAGALLGILALLGIAFSIVALTILKKHRHFYTEMLLRKTFLERELGFYETEISGYDLSFPWKVDRQFVPHLVSDPDQWVTEHRFRKGTVSRLLLHVYCGVIALFAVVIVGVLFGFYYRYF